MKASILLIISVLLSLSPSFVSQTSTSAKDTVIITNGITPVYVENVDASIIPPAGFKYLNNISSFINRDQETSISIVKSDSISYYFMVGAILKSDFDAQNVKLLSTEELKDRRGMFFKFRFEVQGIGVIRLVYVTGNEKISFTVSANYKESEDKKYYPIMRKALLTLTY